MMKLLFDFFPILVFFIVFKLYGIYVATIATIIVCLVQTLALRLYKGRFEKTQVITLFSVLILGGLTLIFHNPIFIKWKPSVVNWLFGLIVLGSQCIGKKPLLQRLMEASLQQSNNQHIHFPAKIWRRINISWGLFFLVMGCLNIFIAYHYNTDVWVNFKLFGMLGLTLVFAIAQSFYLSFLLRQLGEENEQSS